MRASSRGLTLIELMMTVFVASIIILAATQAVVVVTQTRRSSERRLEVADAAWTASSLVEFDAQNAGFRFASPVFSVRVLNNVSGSEAELGGISTTNNCGPANWGIAAGSDTVEFRTGYADLVPGMSAGLSCPSADCTVNLAGVRNPFSYLTPEGNGALVLLNNGAASCLGRVNGDVTTNVMSMKLLGLDLTDSSPGAFPGCATGGEFSVMRLSQRVRYLICQPPASEPLARPGLFRQVSPNAGAFSTPELVQEGIEDLQVALRYDNAPALLSGAGCSGGTCVCFRTPGDCGASVDPNPTTIDSAITATTEAQLPYRLIGLDIGLTAISMRTVAAPSAELEQFVRPALFDHPVGVQQSGNYRRTRQLSLTLDNLSQVQP